MASQGAQEAQETQKVQEAQEALPLVHAIQPFDGAVQSGIEQPAQAHLEMIAFDLDNGVDADQLVALLQEWTALARHLTQHTEIPGFLATDMVAVVANLTITAGFGERIFDVLGKSDLKPEGLHPVPAFSRDELKEQWGQSDLVLQICCDDPVTLFMAARLMIKKALGTAHVLWMQKGFGRAAGAAYVGQTPRNPMGQVDGTVNPREPEEWAEQVWIDSDQPYLNNSSIMVVRRIAMHLDAWEKLDLMQRERVIGRTYHSGAPLTSPDGDEFDEEDMDATDENGSYIIDRHSHLALAREQDDLPNDALRRRAYSYDDPVVPGGDSTNSGLVWISFQKNPDKQFTPIQQRLDENDLLNTWVSHIGSAVYWIVPGTTSDSYWGQGLIEA